MELKTLKDMGECNILVIRDVQPIFKQMTDEEKIKLTVTQKMDYKIEKGFFKEDLKQEAIKWIKEKNLVSDDWIWNNFGAIEDLDEISTSTFIKHFFNIEEELK